LVLIHAANNCFGNWEAFNEMIGLGWRPALFGKAAKIDPETGGVLFPANDTLINEGKSSHGSKHPFQVTVRAAEHPIMRGLPPVWMHARDELYHNMRGLAKNMTILSSAYSAEDQRGSGQHEPLTWEVGYGEGKVIVTAMGHRWPGDTESDSLQCIGFQTILARACEYTATGAVTLPLAEGFPSAEESKILPPHRLNWGVDAESGEKKDPALASALAKKGEDPYCMLAPEERHSTFEIAAGFKAELMASEPQVQEPVLTVWDGNGAMYVAEMRSYIQDEKGTGTKELRNGRVKRFEDTNGDGHYDRVTTFIDGLNLPRAILRLDRRIAVRETDTMDIWIYQDTRFCISD